MRAAGVRTGQVEESGLEGEREILFQEPGAAVEALEIELEGVAPRPFSRPSLSGGDLREDDRLDCGECEDGARGQQRTVGIPLGVDFDSVSSNGQFALELLVLPRAENCAILARDPPLPDLERGSALGA